jgi:hypothetical protein
VKGRGEEGRGGREREEGRAGPPPIAEKSATPLQIPKQSYCLRILFDKHFYI